MRLELKVNPGTWPEAARWAGIAEEVGFDSLWIGDNLRNPPSTRPYHPYSDAAMTPAPVQDRLPIIVAVRRILLADGSIRPWSTPDAFGAMVDRYSAAGIDEIVCYTPKPEERAVFDKLVERIGDWR
jgi:hypothetical protein